ncbi:MAG TPA: hypothetical protein PK040_03095 [Anaerolineaceae bacterium]|nr:hypothetical protein [Anaerolineaceae bacterium]
MSRDRKTTLEPLAYALIFCAALALRLAGIGAHALNDLEAANALGALNLSRGVEGTLPGQPGYLALTTATFFVFQASDFFARFWPALLGALVMLSPLFFRKYLGSLVTLLLALFLAFDPLLVSASTSANGAILAGLGLLASMGFWLKRKPVWMGISLAILLSSGVEMWPGLVAFLLAWAFARVTPASLELDPIQDKKIFYGKVALTVAAVLLLPGTLFLSRPQLLTTLGTSLAEYFHSWAVLGQLTFYQAGLAWLLSVLPGIVFAAWELLATLKKRDAVTRWLGYWWGFALLLTVINPSRAAVELWWASIPMWVLAARRIYTLITDSDVENRLVFIIQGALAVALVIFSFLFFTNLVNRTPVDTASLRNSLLGALLPLALLLVVTLLLGKGWSAPAARYGLLAGISLLLFIGLFGNTWKAAGLGNRFENEIWRGSAQPVGSKLILSSLSDLSEWSTGWKNQMDVLVSGVDSPALRWALRDYEETDYETVYNPNTAPSVIITGSDSEVKSLASYRGQRIVWSVQPDYLSMDIKAWMKWAIFRQAAPRSEVLILWARNDLFPGSN